MRRATEVTDVLFFNKRESSGEYVCGEHSMQNPKQLSPKIDMKVHK